MSTSPHIVILGAGPAGVGAAYRLSVERLARVTVLEQSDRVGGNSGSFDLEGIRADFGSHRFHRSCDPEVLSDIRELLKDDFLDRPRHGRIRMQGRWIHFPLRFSDLVRRLPPRFVIGVIADRLKGMLPAFAGSADSETFASVLEQGLGRTICRDFYFPYARKIWGLPPEEIAAIQAKRRVSSNSVAKIIRRTLFEGPDSNMHETGRFYYPRFGYGQISEAYRDAAIREGAEFIFRSRVSGLEVSDGNIRSVRYLKEGNEQTIEADQVWSTIPISVLVSSLRPAVSDEILSATRKIKFRGMILIYLVLEQESFSEYDAHYFPELEIPISRVSEPKIFSAGQGPKGLTVLCAELPSSPGEAVWNLKEEEFKDLMCDSLQRAGIPVRAPIRKVVIQRLAQAYPIYDHDYRSALDLLERCLDGVRGLLTFGRQGLFVHDNTHHALFMAYSAAKCLKTDGAFDLKRWGEFRKVFDTHVVVD